MLNIHKELESHAGHRQIKEFETHPEEHRHNLYKTIAQNSLSINKKSKYK